MRLSGKPLEILQSAFSKLVLDGEETKYPLLDLEKLHLKYQRLFSMRQ
jgi:hypothetical protein